MISKNLSFGLSKQATAEQKKNKQKKSEDKQTQAREEQKTTKYFPYIYIYIKVCRTLPNLSCQSTQCANSIVSIRSSHRSVCEEGPPYIDYLTLWTIFVRINFYLIALLFVRRWYFFLFCVRFNWTHILNVILGSTRPNGMNTKQYITKTSIRNNEHMNDVDLCFFFCFSSLFF